VDVIAKNKAAMRIVARCQTELKELISAAHSQSNAAVRLSVLDLADGCERARLPLVAKGLRAFATRDYPGASYAMLNESHPQVDDLKEAGWIVTDEVDGWLRLEPPA